MNVCQSNQDKARMKSGEKPNQATKLLELVDGWPLFHDTQRRAYISVPRESTFEHLLLDSSRFEDLMYYLHHKRFHGAASSTAVKDAIKTLQGQARFDGPEQVVNIRSAVSEAGYHLDLRNDRLQSVRISAGSWEIESHCPAVLYRTEVSRSLPTPVSGGSLDPLWSFTNVPERMRILVVTYLIECLRADTNYPLLVIEGEQGSAKSTTQRYLKELLDPSSVPMRVPPKSVKDVYMAAAHDHLLSYNNLSSLPGDLQDGLCCLATGGTHTERALYTNNQEVITNIKRPIMLNGIGGLVTRPDLIERAVYLNLPRLTEAERKTEAELDEWFEQCKPELLGALLDIMVRAMKALPATSSANLPRMADYCILGRAVASACGFKQEVFDRAYQENQKLGLSRALDSCPVYPALVNLLQSRPTGFEGTYQRLLAALNSHRDYDTVGWPKSSKGLSQMLKRQAPSLRAMGIAIESDDQRKKDGYHVYIMPAR